MSASTIFFEQKNQEELDFEIQHSLDFEVLPTPPELYDVYGGTFVLIDHIYKHTWGFEFSRMEEMYERIMSKQFDRNNKKCWHVMLEFLFHKYA